MERKSERSLEEKSGKEIPVVGITDIRMVPQKVDPSNGEPHVYFIGKSRDENGGYKYYRYPKTTPEPGSYDVKGPELDGAGFFIDNCNTSWEMVNRMSFGELLKYYLNSSRFELKTVKKFHNDNLHDHLIYELYERRRIK